MRKKKTREKKLTAVMPKELWKFTAGFLGLKDLKNFKLVCKEAHEIAIEVIKQIKKDHPEIFMREMNAIMLDKFNFFSKHYDYQNKTQEILNWADLDKEEAEQDLDRMHTEVTALLQTKIENKSMKYSKNLGLLLCILGSAFVLAATVWSIIGKSFSPKQFLMLLGGVVGWFAAMTLYGKGYYPKYKNEALVENIRKPTNEIISQETKAIYSSPLTTFFQNRSESFNPLLEDKKLEIIAEELLPRSVEIL